MYLPVLLYYFAGKWVQSKNQDRKGLLFRWKMFKLIELEREHQKKRKHLKTWRQWIFEEKKDLTPLCLCTFDGKKTLEEIHSSAFKLSSVVYKILTIFYQITPKKLEQNVNTNYNSEDNRKEKRITRIKVFPNHQSEVITFSSEFFNN